MKATTMVPSASSHHYVAGLNGCLEGWKKIVTCAERLFFPHCGEPLKPLKRVTN
jgi:hypothetical protein